jgi:hypothetical protein
MTQKCTGKGRPCGRPRTKAADHNVIPPPPKQPNAFGTFLLVSAASLVTDYGFWKGLFAAVILIFA